MGEFIVQNLEDFPIPDEGAVDSTITVTGVPPGVTLTFMTVRINISILSLPTSIFR